MGVKRLLVVALLLAVSPALFAQHKFRIKQTQPDKARILEIQDALVRRHWLPSASGKWDKPTIAALRALAAERGWPTCHVPDARVLNILGLGASTTGIAAPPSNDKNTVEVEQALWEQDHPEECTTP